MQFDYFDLKNMTSGPVIQHKRIRSSLNRIWSVSRPDPEPLIVNNCFLFQDIHTSRAQAVAIGQVGLFTFYLMLELKLLKGTFEIYHITLFITGVYILQNTPPAL